jgi:hypothetical protein
MRLRKVDGVTEGDEAAFGIEYNGEGNNIRDEDFGA